MHDELAVAVPRHSGLVECEGERIDEDGPTLMELDIIGTRVLQYHTALQRRELHI